VAIILAADRVAATMRAHPRIARVIDWAFASVFTAFAAQILLSRAR
jgi:threonine/homoserine/homoserine lactone efflux protein